MLSVATSQYLSMSVNFFQCLSESGLLEQVRGDLTMDDIEASFQLDRSVPIPLYPSELIYLVSPGMTRCETKRKIKCTLAKVGALDLSYGGVNLVRTVGQDIVEWERTNQSLKQWGETLRNV
tara:strand:+ start:253 stop:618 length:366 start_codon:yes stop_codon:yes gene_type:complete